MTLKASLYALKVQKLGNLCGRKIGSTEIRTWPWTSPRTDNVGKV